MDAKKLEEIYQMKSLDISELNEEYQEEMRRLYEFFLKQQKKGFGDKIAKSW